MPVMATVFSRPRTPAAKCLHLVRLHQIVTRSELVEATGLSQPTITRAISALIGAGLVHERTDLTRSQGRGRPTIPLELTNHAALHAGIAVGTSTTYIGLFDTRGRTIRDADVPTPVAELTESDFIEHVMAGLNRLTAGLDRPLASVGVRGIGSAPALIALTLYALLPIVRNTYTGLKGVPSAATEAGRGMGMSPRQLLLRVQLPLALPLVVEGLRAAAVLTIGTTTVAYLIGAGGLGVFIQRGIDQVVPDLVLLGAIPIILLALLVDGLLRILGTALTPRGVREPRPSQARGLSRVSA